MDIHFSILLGYLEYNILFGFFWLDVIIVVPCTFIGDLLFFHEGKNYYIRWDLASFSPLPKATSNLKPFKSPSFFGAYSSYSCPKVYMSR